MNLYSRALQKWFTTPQVENHCLHNVLERCMAILANQCQKAVELIWKMQYWSLSTIILCSFYYLAVMATVVAWQQCAPRYNTKGMKECVHEKKEDKKQIKTTSSKTAFAGIQNIWKQYRRKRRKFPEIGRMFFTERTKTESWSAISSLLSTYHATSRWQCKGRLTALIYIDVRANGLLYKKRRLLARVTTTRNYKSVFFLRRPGCDWPVWASQDSKNAFRYALVTCCRSRFASEWFFTKDEFRFCNAERLHGVRPFARSPPTYLSEGDVASQAKAAAVRVRGQASLLVNKKHVFGRLEAGGVPGSFPTGDQNMRRRTKLRRTSEHTTVRVRNSDAANKYLQAAVVRWRWGAFNLKQKREISKVVAILIIAEVWRKLKNLLLRKIQAKLRWKSSASMLNAFLMWEMNSHDEENTMFFKKQQQSQIAVKATHCLATNICFAQWRKRNFCSVCCLCDLNSKFEMKTF